MLLGGCVDWQQAEADGDHLTSHGPGSLRGHDMQTAGHRGTFRIARPAGAVYRRPETSRLS